MTRTFAIMLLCFSSALAGCGQGSETIRYRATAIFDVGGKTVSGSAVRETSYTDTPNSLTGFGMSVKDNGEAIVVEVGEGSNPIYVLRNSKARKQ